MRKKLSISKRALIQRINRKLKPQEEMLRVSRSRRWYFDCGDYFIVNLRFNSIERGHIDLEGLGKELGVLARYEQLED